MPQLPDRPHLDQLRHQARELHRAAAAGDAAALRRLHSVSDTVTLSAAQLALAREYDFASWPRLRAEVERARNIGSGTINLRIALTAPGDVDEEVTEWLRRAYQQSVAPPAPRKPPRRLAPVVGEITVLIDGFDLPGLTCGPEPGGAVHQNIHVALSSKNKDRPALAVPGRPGLATEPVRGDAGFARWEVTVTVRRGDDGLDFGGQYVRGDHTDRHLGLIWGDVPGDGTLRLFRGAKLRLVDVRPPVVISGTRAVEAGHLRSGAEQRRRVPQVRELLHQQRPDHSSEELAGKLTARDENGSHAGDPAGSGPACRLVFARLTSTSEVPDLLVRR